MTLIPVITLVPCNVLQEIEQQHYLTTSSSATDNHFPYSSLYRAYFYTIFERCIFISHQYHNPSSRVRQA
jgi:hypothetical protein